MYTALRSLWWRPFWVVVENASKWQTSTVPASIIETIPIEILWSYSLVSQWVDSSARCLADGFELQFTRNTNIPLKLGYRCIAWYIIKRFHLLETEYPSSCHNRRRIILQATSCLLLNSFRCLSDWLRKIWLVAWNVHYHIHDADDPKFLEQVKPYLFKT